MSSLHKCVFAVCLAALFVAGEVFATVPYSPIPFAVGPAIGPGVQSPKTVPGKEYSHDLDESAVPPGGILDPEQVMAWDGFGGTADTIDFSFTRPMWQVDQELDAIANSRDTLFDETLLDQSHLLFTHDDVTATYVGGPGGGATPTLTPISNAGPVNLSSGNVIGGSGEISVEESGVFGPPFPPATQWLWATQPEINAMPAPRDVDGLEVWGPEPQHPIEPGVPVVGDADKYSLDTDLPSGISVWNASGSPYIPQSTIISAVTSLLGPAPASAFDLRDGSQGAAAINLDALMVSDIVTETDTFNLDGNPNEEVFDQSGVPLPNPNRGDAIIFSIRQIVDPIDPDGYYATGSELFVLDATAGPRFLFHGGHLWDQAYSLTDLAILTFPLILGDIDGDGVVGLSDLNILGANWGGPGPAGDLNGDGTVDLADLNILGATWGNVSIPDFTVIDINGIEAVGTEELILASEWKADAVPEPMAAALLVSALGLLAAYRRTGI